MLKYAFALLAGLAAPVASAVPMDLDNPTCPAKPDWTSNATMMLTPSVRDGIKVLLAEGQIDSGLPGRLKAALAADPDIAEIWMRSPGGDARAGNAAGLVIREAKAPIITRIPSGWACFSACNFLFMGGRARIIDPGGHFMVHMFTFTNDRQAIAERVGEGTQSTAELIGEVEQDAALLASEDNDFLIRTGVSRKLLTEIMYKQKAIATRDGDRSTRRCLTVEEALKYNVANVGG